MATNLIPFRPIAVQACASSGARKPDPARRNSSSANWWTPLFGWSSEPDYIDSDGAGRSADPASAADDTKLAARSDRISPGGFTEEKARRLRMMTPETFHDKMYHSAIASRLASDFGNPSDV